MNIEMSVQTWIAVALLAAFSLTMFAVFLTKRDTKTTTATIKTKTFVPESTYNPTVQGANRGFRTPPSIAIAAHYTLELDADGLGSVRASVNEVAAKQLNVGDRVTIKYQVRGFLGIWKKVYVLEVTPAK
jgi:hypothetical protein